MEKIKEFFNESSVMRYDDLNENNIQVILQLIEKQKITVTYDKVILRFYGYYQFINKKESEMVNFLDMAIELGDNDSLYFCMYYFQNINNNQELARRYYDIYFSLNIHFPIECKNILYNLGLICEHEESYNDMKNYYTQAIEKGSKDAVYSILIYYCDKEPNLDILKRYSNLLDIIGDTFGLVILGQYYESIDEYEEMKNHYEVAIKKGDVEAMNRLGNYYKETENYEEMKYYYMMAIEKGDTRSMVELGNYYRGRDNVEMTKYYLMAAEKGDPFGVYYLSEDYVDVKN